MHTHGTQNILLLITSDCHSIENCGALELNWGAAIYLFMLTVVPHMQDKIIYRFEKLWTCICCIHAHGSIKLKLVLEYVNVTWSDF